MLGTIIFITQWTFYQHTTEISKPIVCLGTVFVSVLFSSYHYFHNVSLLLFFLFSLSLCFSPCLRGPYRCFYTVTLVCFRFSSRVSLKMFSFFSFTSLSQSLFEDISWALFFCCLFQFYLEHGNIVSETARFFLIRLLPFFPLFLSHTLFFSHLLWRYIDQRWLWWFLCLSFFLSANR